MTRDYSRYTTYYKTRIKEDLFPDTCTIYPAQGTVTMSAMGTLQTSAPTARTYNGSTSIPCRLDVNRSFRGADYRLQAMDLDEYRIHLPHDITMLETDTIVAGGYEWHVKKLATVSEWDLVTEAIIMRSGRVEELDSTGIILRGKLVSSWSFEGNANDDTENYNLSEVNTPAYETAKLNQGVKLTAANSEYLRSTASGLLDVFADGNSWTICGWAEQFQSNSTLMGVGSSASDFLGIYTTTVVVGRFEATGGTVLATIPAPSGDYFWALTHDADTKTIVLYVDGTSDSEVYTGSIATIRSELAIGALPAGSRYADHWFDQCLVFNEALSSDEVSWLYNSDIGRLYTEFVGS